MVECVAAIGRLGTGCLVAVGMGALLVGGCAEPSREPTILQARAQPFVVDVPLPKGFDLDRRKSTHNFSAGKRKIKHYYVGHASPLAVSNFYRQKMPEYQWELLDRQLQNGVDVLKYRKGQERCEVRIEETPGALFGSKTQVSVIVQPEP